MAITDNLIAYWSLEEASGTAADAVGFYPLSDASSTTGTTGKVGNGRTFVAASSQTLTHIDTADLSVDADQAFTWAFWMKVGTNPGSGDQALIGKVEPSGAFPMDYLIRYDFDGAYIRLSVTGSGGNVTASGDTAAPDGTWTFVVVWHDPAADVLGVSVNAQATPVTLSHTLGTTDATGSLTFGNDSLGGPYFDGMLDEVGFWKRVLTPTEITWLYHGGSGRSYADLVIGTFADIRQDILNGFDSAQSEPNGWDATIATVPVTSVVRASDTVVTITLPAMSTYAITANETITATVPAVALTGAAPLTATPTMGITAGVVAMLTGTAVGGITEADVVAGGKTIIITITGDTVIAS